MTETSEPAASAPHRGRVRWGWIFGGFIALVLLIALSLLFAPPSAFFTSLLQRAVLDATGRELKVESSSYVIRETVTIELNGVALGGPPGQPADTLLTARTLRATLPLKSFIDRKLDLTSLELDAPVINLVRKSNGDTNWTTGADAVDGRSVPSDLPGILALPPSTLRNGTLLYTDEGAGSRLRLDTIDARLAVDRKYGGAAAQGSLRYNNEPLTFDLTLADAAAAFGGMVTTIGLAIDGRVLKAKLAGDAAIGELPMLAGEIEATTPSARELANWLGFGDGLPAGLGSVSFKGRTDGATGRMEGAGIAVLRDESVTYDLTLEDLRQALKGEPSRISGDLSATDLEAGIDGTLALGETAKFDGTVDAQTPSIGSLAQRFGITHAAVTGLGPGTVKGKTTIAAGEDLIFEGAAFDAGGRTGTFTGTLALSGQRPRISGALEISQIDIDALTGRTPPVPMSLTPEAMPPDDGFETTWDVLSAELDEIENPPAPAFGLAATATPAPVWSTDPIDLTGLRGADLDLDLTARTVKFGTLNLKDARIKTRLDNGELAAKIESIAVGAGQGTGTIDLKARGAEHAAAIALKLTGVEAEPITYELSGKPLLKGTSNVDITTTATGKSLNQLVSTLAGNARFDMNKGRLRGWDIGRMVEELWNYKGWGYNPQRNTPVDKLTANYTVKSGIIRSAPDLTMSGPNAGLRSTGDVVVPRRLIDQHVKVQNLFFNIVVKGDWTKKLWIGPAFLAGLSQDTKGAAPEAPPAAQLPRAMPADVMARIERILETPATAARLSPHGKAVLQSLLAAARSGS